MAVCSDATGWLGLCRVSVGGDRGSPGRVGIDHAMKGQ